MRRAGWFDSARRYEVSTVNWIIGGALVGVGVLWWRNRQAQEDTRAPGPSGGELGDTACALAKKAALAAGLPWSDAACSVVTDIVEALPFAPSAQEHRARVEEYDAKNRELNGPVALPMAGQVSIANQGTVLRFANGCVPFRGAAGWEACAPGTNSMWPTDTDPGKISEVRAGPQFGTAEAKRAWQAANEPDDVPITPQALLSGDVTTQNPDPSTVIAWELDGSSSGYFRGEAFACPPGQAPALWDAQGNVIGWKRAGVPPCAPGGVSEFVPSSAPPPATTGTMSTDGSGERLWTGMECGPNGTAPAGYTWTGSTWRRLAAGETPNPGPCAPTYQSSQLAQQTAVTTSLVSKSAGSGTLAVSAAWSAAKVLT